MITIWSYWSPKNSKYHYQYNDHECIVINCITKITITNVSGQIHYQYNDHVAFWGPLITGIVHRAHDHIHDLQRLQYDTLGEARRGMERGVKLREYVQLNDEFTAAIERVKRK